MHTCGPIHQQFNWLPKLTRSCSLFQVPLLTLRSRVSSPLEVGGNTQPNCARLTPSLSSSFFFVCLQARCLRSVQRPPLKFCILTPFPQRFNDFYSFAYADEIRVVSLLSGLSCLTVQPIRLLSSINHWTVTLHCSVPVHVKDTPLYHSS